MMVGIWSVPNGGEPIHTFKMTKEGLYPATRKLRFLEKEAGAKGGWFGVGVVVEE
jgi:hypothetical protein